MNILILNAGSSSLKFQVRALTDETSDVLVRGVLERVGMPDARLQITRTGEETQEESIASDDAGAAVETVISRCREWGIEAVGFRVVHGGSRFTEPTRLTPETLAELRTLNDLAPLHNPVALAGIETALRLLPGMPAVAVFDTAFHRTIPPVAATYALPYELSERLGLRRYGFHGISHRYVSERLQTHHSTLISRLITCHLGNGASVCAIKDGQSVETSMGLTPLEGLIMGTRSGDIDPGLLLHLLRTESIAPDALDVMLNHASGLKGISGLSGDMRDLEKVAKAGNERAERAIAAFAYRVRKYIGAYAAVLGGLDALVFTAGIGEHSPDVRARCCEGLEFLGLHLSPERNTAADGKTFARLSTDESSVSVWLVPTDEEAQIAREVYALLS